MLQKMIQLNSPGLPPQISTEGQMRSNVYGCLGSAIGWQLH